MSKIDANPSSAGIDEAQKVFDLKKDSLKAKFDTFKNAESVRISADGRKKIVDSSINNAKLLRDVKMKNMSELSKDKDALAKFQKLMNDYADTFRMP